MESSDGASRNRQIVNELKQAIERMSAPLTPDIEPAVVFSLEKPDNSPIDLQRVEHSE